MPGVVNVEQIRRVMVETIGRQPQNTLQVGSILSSALETLNLPGNNDNEQILLTVLHDLFRTGYLAWGLNFSNPDPPFCHVTEQGRSLLRNFSRDPANPDGYLTHLRENTSINPIAESYLKEALQTYNTDCYRSAAVMVGVATESIILELRDALVLRMEQLGLKPSKDLTHWLIKRILDSLEKELHAHQNQMSPDLGEFFEQYWSAFIGQIRISRNDAGHPISVESTTRETVQASLLIFPEIVKLAVKLKVWISSQYIVINNNS